MVDTKKREAPNQNQTEKTATLRHAIGICVALALLLELLVESFCRHSRFLCLLVFSRQSALFFI